ncbi:cell division protein FtsZ [Psychromonas marina]|uniref:Cell division protein FtsZ n=1 Tax=Psychromonas marina TaxID=88364 RepID=A0ABQ6DXF6_9GAMM|nr:cell division protein FtsZ [Psychromonas marina]GLS89838.1 cell division protein FtsZ [Psychromonas marina]
MSDDLNKVEKDQMFEIVDEEYEQQAVIKVVGVGGGGGNAVNHMIDQGLMGAEFIVMNTDAQALRKSKATIRLQLGASITNGLGAGANPEVGYKSALEDKETIREMLTGADVVFIAAGMGGGTGTGASPVVAEVAKELGALTIGVVSKPSFFEGKKRINYANQGISRLSEHIDSLLIIPNDKLQKSLPKGVTFLGALEAANGVLYDAVSGFSAIINNEESTINIDFADVRTVMTEAGTTAVMGIGIASGEERAEEAVEQAISCPLLEDVDLSNARGVLVHIVAGMDFAWDEYETVGDALREFASEDSQIIIGVTVDPTIDTADLHVTVIVTGLGERKSDLTVVKNPTVKAEAAVLTETVAEAVEEKVEDEVVEEPVVEAAKVEGSYLDIPAFLRKQAD